MSETKKDLIEQAKLAELVGGYDDMAAAMKEVVKLTPVLSEEERRLLAVAYQKVVERRLNAWRILNLKKEACEEGQHVAKAYCDKVEKDLKWIITDVLHLLNQFLIPKSANLPSEIFYLHMKEQYYNGYFAEVAPGEHSDGHEFAAWKVNYVSDGDLLGIFKHLPPYDRLRVSEVCQRWHHVCEEEWAYISHLDLSQVPTANIHAVIRKCPKLVSVSALRQNLGDLCRFFSRLNTQTSLKCIGCDFTAPHTTDHEGMYACLRSSQLRELIWHSSRTVWFDYPAGEYEYLMPLSLPPTLRRLELVALDRNISRFDGDAFNLPLLESVIFASLSMPKSEAFMADGTDFLQTWPGVGALACLHASENLREAYLDTPHRFACTKLVFALAKLEVLFLNNATFDQENTGRLMLQHRSLRILVLTASPVSDFADDDDFADDNAFVGEIVIADRKRFPRDLHAEPVPQLQLFLGKIASQRLRFTPSESDALKISAIDAPLPQFLEKDGVKSVFKGSWIASRIRDLAENGERLVDYYFEGNTEEILYTQ